MIKRNILLNPGPCTTSDQVKTSMVVPDICPREAEFCEIMKSINEDIPKLVNGGSDYVSVLFASSGTGAVEAVITSSIPQEGKLLIVENGAYGTRIKNIAERYLIKHSCYKLDYGDYPDLDSIEGLIKKEQRISHIAIVDHETTTGMRNPVEQICKLAHKYNIEVIVDCMSSFGGIPIDLQKWQAEYIVSSANKCIQGMAGLSFVIFKKVLLDKIKNNARSFYFDLYSQYYGFNNTGQMQFTPPVQIVYALRKALDLFFEETIEGRINRYQKNYEILFEGLKKIGFKFLLPNIYQSGILIAVREPKNIEYNFRLMHDYFYEHGFTIYPGKGAKEATFRLAIIGNLHQKDIHSFIRQMKIFLSTIGITNLEY